MPIIDTHCHLDFDVFAEGRIQLLHRCQGVGVSHIIVPGVIARDLSRVWNLCRDHSMLSAALGLHPCFMDQHDEQSLGILESLLEENRPVAVGEIGLDLYERQDNYTQQRALFVAQLEIARSLGLPVILHVRKAHDQVQKCLRQVGFSNGGTVHAYSGSLQQAQKYLAMGFRLGIGGGATYDRANKLHRIIRTLPASAFVLETDSPDIPPCFARGKPNTPLNLPGIVQRICELCELDESWIEASTQNAIALFGLAANTSTQQPG